MQHLFSSVKESLQSVLPIAAIVLWLSVSFAPLNAGVLVLFLFGTLMLIAGMSFFTIGSSMSMEPLGDGVGASLNKSKKLIIPIVVSFLLGMIVTIAEPDLQVLAEQVPGIPNVILVLCVGLGVGIFLSLSFVRAKKQISLVKLLMIFYTIVIGLTFFVPKDFIPTAFDSGGVTTGPITVPFIMALGAGLATTLKGKHSNENSFGLVALCSIGPILSVLILSICYKPEITMGETLLPEITTTVDAFYYFLVAIPQYSKEVLISFIPIVVVFLIFQLLTRRFKKHWVEKIIIGLIYTYIGLVLFLTGANVGFMPAGKLIGGIIAGGKSKYLLIPVGMLMGYFVVLAEPAVHSLKKQVSEITNGAISQKSVSLALSIGVAFSVGISMFRILAGISIMPFVLVGYIISLGISFFVPPIYTAIAFDSGGVASGPMTSTFMLPFAMGACETLGGNIMTDAFGIVAMIAMTPLITIQVLGLISNVKKKRKLAQVSSKLYLVKDDIIYFKKENKNGRK